MSSSEGNKKDYTRVNPEYLPTREAVKIWLQRGGYITYGISFCFTEETGGYWDTWVAGVRGEPAWESGTISTGVEVVKGKKALELLKNLGYLLTDVENPGDGIYFSSNGPIELRDGKWTSTEHVVKDRKYTVYKKSSMYNNQWYLHYGSLCKGHRMFFWKEICMPRHSVKAHVPETTPVMESKDLKHVETKTSEVEHVGENDPWLVAQRKLVREKAIPQLRELMFNQLETADGPEKEKLKNFWLSSEVPRM